MRGGRRWMRKVSLLEGGDNEERRVFPAVSSSAARDDAEERECRSLSSSALLVSMWCSLREEGEGRESLCMLKIERREEKKREILPLSCWGKSGFCFIFDVILKMMDVCYRSKEDDGYLFIVKFDYSSVKKRSSIILFLNIYW